MADVSSLSIWSATAARVLSSLRTLARRPNDTLDKLDRALGIARAKVVLFGCEVGRRVCVQGPVRVHNQGRIVIGDRAFFLHGMIPTEITCHPGAVIEVGNDTGFNYGVSVAAHQSICIGDRCMFASMVHLGDREHDRTAPITIGDDVWVAHGAIVGPGVTIGNGSVVAAGSVVMQDVPAKTMAIGNPARIIALDAH
jgi:maltose O-acetyltransferase